MESIEGLNEEKAKTFVRQAGYAWRVEEIDGESFGDIEDSVRKDRVTAKIEDGVVVSARIG